MKNIFSGLITLIIISEHASAQTKDTISKPVKTGNEWHMPGDAIKRSQDFAENLKKDLGLDDATTKKVFNAYLGNTKSVDEIGVLSMSEKEKKEKMKANKTAFDEKLKGILSADQFSKYMKMQKGKVTAN